MATIGHIQEFDPIKEKVSAYLERVQMFLVANSIEAEKSSCAVIGDWGEDVHIARQSISTGKTERQDVQTVIRRATEAFRTEASGDRSEVPFS